MPVEGTPAVPGLRRQSGAVIVLAMAFVLLLSYIGLAGVDLAAVEGRLAQAVRVQAEARAVLDGATRVIVAREMARLQLALAGDTVPLCPTAGFCEVSTDVLAMKDGVYRAVYQTRVLGAQADASAPRQTQARVSSAVRYRSSLFDIDIGVVRATDNAMLARAAAGIEVSAASGGRE